MECHNCGCPEFRELGTLGNKLWVRCVACGMDLNIEEDEKGLILS